MASKHSPASTTSSKRKSMSMSKTDQKRALVAKRLSMLQDDPQNQNRNFTRPPTIPSSVTPLQSHSESNPGKRKKLKKIYDDDDDDDSQKQISVRDVDNKNSDEIIAIPSPTPSPPSSNPNKERAADEKLSTAMERALKVQANLSAAHPSFVKMMLPSHVSGGFWLHLPSKFCDVNLPKLDCSVVLVDSKAGKEFKTNYLAHKKGLSGGWRAFSIHHELQKGDVLVFHLINPTTFKVYIVREDRLNEIDGALGLLELDSTFAGQMISGVSTQKVLHTEGSPPTGTLSSPSNSDTDLRPEVLDGIRFSDSDTKFEAVSDFNNFNIIVDGLVIDSKFSQPNRHKYYELCLSQNSFLHQNLLKGLNCNLVIGIILETINIADAVKASDSSTSVEDLQTWKTTLTGFELMGMDVSFLCDRLCRVLNLVDAASNRSEIEQGAGSARMKTLEDKLAELKGVMEKIDYEIEAEMTASVQKYKAKIRQIDKFRW